MATISNILPILTTRAAYARTRRLSGQSVAIAFGLIAGSAFACLCTDCACKAEDRGELGDETYRLDYWTECSRCENRDGEPTVVVPLTA